jgi:hypothetical protein
MREASPPSDFTGFELVAVRNRVLRALIVNEVIALPIALVMAAVDGQIWHKLLVANLYAQSIGMLCSIASCYTFPRIAGLSPRRQRAAVALQFFLCGIAGAEIARGLFIVIYGTVPGPRLINWAIAVTVAGIVGMVITTVHQLRTTVEARERSLAESEVTEARLLQGKSDAELAALQARIHPHFLFNTLNAIAALIREDPAKAEAVTLQLSALFRYALQAPRLGMVTLEDELVIVRGYLDIEQVRLGERLRYEIDVPAALRGERLPPLLLQPLVENAIRHGLSTRVEGGQVTVRGWKEQGNVYLVVADSGGGTPNPGTGEGLQNVRGRLQAAFGPQAALTLERVEGGTEARLVFPASVTASA